MLHGLYSFSSKDNAFKNKKVLSFLFLSSRDFLFKINIKISVFGLKIVIMDFFFEIIFSF